MFKAVVLRYSGLFTVLVLNTDARVRSARCSVLSYGGFSSLSRKIFEFILVIINVNYKTFRILVLLMMYIFMITEGGLSSFSEKSKFIDFLRNEENPPQLCTVHRALCTSLKIILTLTIFLVCFFFSPE